MIKKIVSKLGINGKKVDGSTAGNSGQPDPPEDQRTQQPAHLVRHMEDPKAAAAKAKSIKRCSDLLRRKYELDIDTWACGADEENERQELQRKSDALFREVQRNVYYWLSTSPSRWTEGEWQQLQIIGQIIDAQGSGRDFRKL
jgi:hypothetical protein